MDGDFRSSSCVTPAADVVCAVADASAAATAATATAAATASAAAAAAAAAEPPRDCSYVGPPNGCVLSFVRIIRSGSLVAIMGPSGCGKTTLLNCLSGKKRDIRGDIYLNASPLVYRHLKQVAVYVPQEPVFTGQEVVREVLEFCASLKTNYNAAEIKQIVDGALSFLGLEKVANQQVGNERVRGISGGEKKRLMAGGALISLSQLCFADEITSGLFVYLFIYLF
ncbi:ABC transporter family protein, related [Eimeria acervulina]|uniref:ABC transporter family protein, related n=1 Tax=Eimeria acervulina TaxID=5801 RepID=U6GM47_EIMAC|nr:ABC transporter family protein, related [Eimeria acervulina]CDI81291.1 ABC transporter family protein, related [Eimeria acervulina]